MVKEYSKITYTKKQGWGPRRGAVDWISRQSGVPGGPAPLNKNTTDTPVKISSRNDLILKSFENKNHDLI